MTGRFSMDTDLACGPCDDVVGAMPDERAQDGEARTAAPDDEDALVLLMAA
jgi:hypothetical protein